MTLWDFCLLVHETPRLLNMLSLHLSFTLLFGIVFSLLGKS